MVPVAIESGSLGCFLVPHVADTLEEEQRQDVRLPIRTVHGAAAQDLRAAPEVRLQFLESHYHSMISGSASFCWNPTGVSP